MVKSAELDWGTRCSRYVPAAIQLRESPNVASIFWVKSSIDSASMFDSIATRNWRIGPAVPSTGPAAVAYVNVPGPACGNCTVDETCGLVDGWIADRGCDAEDGCTQRPSAASAVGPAADAGP